MSVRYGFMARDIVRSGRIRTDSFEELKSWCSRQNVSLVLTEEQLIIFLLCTSNDVEVAKATIRAHFQHKMEAPELFLDRDPDGEDLQKAMEICMIVHLPVRTRDNDAIFFSRFRDLSKTSFCFESSVKLGLLISELPLHQNPPDGVVGVLDMRGLSWMHITKLRLGALRKLLRYVQEGYPFKIKQMHIFNPGLIFEKVFLIAKPFIKKRFLDVLHVHSRDTDMSVFFEKYIPKQCVPQDYGGDLAPLEVLCEPVYRTVKDLHVFYKAEEQQIRTVYQAMFPTNN